MVLASGLLTWTALIPRIGGGTLRCDRPKQPGGYVAARCLRYACDHRPVTGYESQPPVVAVVLTVPEPASHPVDREAVILGGQRAADVGCYLDAGLRSA